MTDLISRQALLAEYDRLHVGEPGRARKMIEDAPSVTISNQTDDLKVTNCNDSDLVSRQTILNLPSAQPEIIYCKNCIYYRWEIDMCDYPYSTAHNVVHEYDYCSKAERRTNESD